MSKDEVATTSTVAKEIDQSTRRKQRLLGGLFITTVAGTSAGLGIALGVASSRKYATQSTAKGAAHSAKAVAALDISAFSLAIRALGWGTFYAVSGVGALTLGVSLLMGVRNLQEFRQSMEKFFKSHVPDIPRNKTPGRTEFNTFRELFEYLAAGEEASSKKSGSKD